MSRLALMIAGLTLSAGLATSQGINFKAAGNFPDASFSTSEGGYKVDGMLFAVVGQSGQLDYYVLYHVEWQVEADLPYSRHFLEVVGLAPATAVKSQGAKLVSVDVDIPMLRPDSSNPGSVVRHWKCIGFESCVLVDPPTSAPFKGTFASNLGAPGSSSTSSMGLTKRVEYYAGGKSVDSMFNGQLNEETCNFSGTVGEAVLTAPTTGDCTIRLFRGQTAYYTLN